MESRLLQSLLHHGTGNPHLPRHHLQERSSDCPAEQRKLWHHVLAHHRVPHEHRRCSEHFQKTVTNICCSTAKDRKPRARFSTKTFHQSSKGLKLWDVINSDSSVLINIDVEIGICSFNTRTKPKHSAFIILIFIFIVLVVSIHGIIQTLHIQQIVHDTIMLYGS
ncbi:hypothetical protein WICPIJ_004415 [Wickerhamomyces pijperi]|uniref:Uncharacterized protein n=1 Tax=Wickerhamomyces pijperi TaxID=599730 RepID=A0A9P8TMS9_WICPI|nr:hypothetical protein WICPIJ_004415 [Wickerhamomyces pijperi]